MRIRLAFFAVLLVAQLRGDTQPFPLIGLWHSVSATTADGRDITPRGGGLELAFLPEGVLVQTVVSSSRTDNEPIRYRGRYTFQSPDKVTYSYTRGGEENTQEQRFRVDGDIATFENLESGIITKMRRIQRSEFKPPRDVPDIPK
jgi:hypothetical protein